MGQDAATTTRHTCNPAKPGHPKAFGKRAPEGECARCDELRAGAEPRQLAWAENYARQRRHDEQLARDIRDHDCHTARCGIVCTFGQW